MRTKRKFSLEFKKKVVEEIKAGVLTKAQAIRQYEIGYTLIARWTEKYDHGNLINEPSDRGALENKIAELERKVGQQAMEIDLLKKVREHCARRLKEKSSALTVKELLGRGVKS